MIIIVIGPTNSGKTKFLEFCEDYGIKRVITNTTRKMRAKERQGVDYYFRTKKQFQKKLKNGDFIETTEIYGEYYGTEFSEIKKNCVLALDPKGFLKLKKHFNDSVFSIFLEVPETERCERARKRGDNLKEVSKRVLEERSAFNQIKNKVDLILTEPTQIEINKLISKNKKIWIEK